MMSLLLLPATSVLHLPLRMVRLTARPGIKPCLHCLRRLEISYAAASFSSKIAVVLADYHPQKTV